MGLRITYSILLTLVNLAIAAPPHAVHVPSTLTSFPTTLTKTKWTSYSTSTEYPNKGMPLFSEEQWVDTTKATVYEPWMSAPTAFPYTLVRIGETTVQNEVRVTTEWGRAPSTISLLSSEWTVRETFTLRG